MFKLTQEQKIERMRGLIKDISEAARFDDEASLGRTDPDALDGRIEIRDMQREKAFFFIHNEMSKR
jgi:hypothetical protein